MTELQLMLDTSAPPALAQGKEVAECLWTSHQSPASYVRAETDGLGSRLNWREPHHLPEGASSRRTDSPSVTNDVAVGREPTFP